MSIIATVYLIVAFSSFVSLVWCDDNANGDYFWHGLGSAIWPAVLVVAVPFALSIGLVRAIRWAKSRATSTAYRPARAVSYRDDAGPHRCNECGRAHEAT